LTSQLNLIIFSGKGKRGIEMDPVNNRNHKNRWMILFIVVMVTNYVLPGMMHSFMV